MSKFAKTNHLDCTATATAQYSCKYLLHNIWRLSGEFPGISDSVLDVTGVGSSSGHQDVVSETLGEEPEHGLDDTNIDLGSRNIANVEFLSSGVLVGEVEIRS